MKQFDIEIDETSPKVNQFTQTIGQNFSIMIDFKGWTTNKATSNMELFDQDGNKVTQRMVGISETQILHICSPISKDTKLILKIASTSNVLVPSDVVQLVAASPSEKCNDYSYMGNQIAPNISDVKVAGPIEVDLNNIYGPFNKMDIKMGNGSAKPELKVTDKDGNSIIAVQAWGQEQVGPIVVTNSKRQIIMNYDKLMLNGVQMALKEVTFGDTTLSVLAAV